MHLLLKIAIGIVLWILMGAVYVLLTALLTPQKLMNKDGFRQDVAFLLLFVYPAPIFILIIRGLLYPAKKLSQRFKLPEESIE